MICSALREAARFPLARQVSLFESRAYECYLTSQMEEAIQARQSALHIWQQLGNMSEVGNTRRWLSRLSWFIGEPGEAHEHARAAVDLLETLPPDCRLSLAYSNRAQLAMLADDIDEALSWGERALGLAESLQDAETLVHALNNVGTARLIGGDQRGRTDLEQSMQLALAHGWEEHVSRAYANLVSCAIVDRDYAQAEHFLRAGLAYCTEHDMVSWETYMGGWQARASFEQGRWDEAVEIAARVLAHTRLPTAARVPALAVLGAVYVRRGEPDSGPVLDDALALGTKEAQRIIPVAAARAEAAWLRGDSEQCLAEIHSGYDLALQRWDQWRRGELSIWLWRAGGLLAMSEPLAEPFARQIAGAWQEAAELWERIGCPYEQALALSAEDTSAQLSALELFEQLGARPAAALVRRQLRQQGVTGVPRGPLLFFWARFLFRRSLQLGQTPLLRAAGMLRPTQSCISGAIRSSKQRSSTLTKFHNPNPKLAHNLAEFR